MRARTAAALLLLFAAAIGRTAAAPAPRATDPVSESPSVVLERYARALDDFVAPKVVGFEYSVEQVGSHDLIQTHRIYRSRLTERDEITSVDGQALPHPSVRIIRKRVDHYSIAAVAPRPAQYAFAFLGKRRSGNHFDYLFATHARVTTPFFVRAVAIDGVRYLPSQVVFSATTSIARAEGRLLYGAFDKHWMIVEAAVTARVAGKVARERIAFGRYVFPETLPESTFIQPRASSSAAP